MIYIEIGLYLFILGILVSTRPVSRLLSEAEAKLRIAILFLFLFLVAAQVLNKTIYTYPFTHWGMYSSSHPNPVYHTYEIELQNTEIKPYPFELITATSSRAFMSKLKNLEWSRRTHNTRYLHSTIQQLIWLYEKNHPGIKIENFFISKIELDPDAYGPDYIQKKKMIYKYKETK